MRLVMAIALLAGLAGCAVTPAQQARNDKRAAAAKAKLDEQLAGLVKGPTTSCIPSTLPTIQTTAYGPTILYRVSRGLVYRTDTAGGCEGAGNGDILVSRQYQGRACNGDIATTVNSASRFQTGSCTIGDFTEYRAAK